MRQRRMYDSWVIAILFCAGSMSAVAKDIYYTQHTFFAEKNVHQTTNYHVGVLIPINTEVEIIDMNDSAIRVVFPELDRLDIKVRNAQKHTLKPIEEIKNRMFAKTKVNLRGIKPEYQDNIKAGIVAVGMTKQEVLMAYGYPPAHVTSSLDSDSWTYWKNRFNRVIVEFKADKVVNIKD